jgi:hypothetical protein
MPALATIEHAPQWVSYGPSCAYGGPADWCKLDNVNPRYLAPGGVVLCKRDTTEIHPYAESCARSAWIYLQQGNEYGQYPRNPYRGWLPPLPILTNVDVRNANKYTRRAITTAADRAAAEKNIKRPVTAGAA